MNNIKPSREIYTGIEKSVRSLLIENFHLNVNASDNEIFDAWDNFNKMELTSYNENLKLKSERAELSIGDFINKGMLDEKLRSEFIKLATDSYDLTIEIINNQYKTKLELQQLLKFTGHELYMSDKLERLKEISNDHFLLKYAELNKPDISESKIKNEDLVSLSGKELYMSGKLETLKEIDFDVFKLKYKEFFGVEFKD
jgi:hypothetical protein